MGWISARRAWGLAIPAVFWADAAAAQTSETTSQGGLQTETYVYDGQRNDSYDTRFVGTWDGEVLFDITSPRAFDDAQSQALLAEQTGPRGMAMDGAPGVLTWTAPTLTDSYEAFLDSFTESSVTMGPVTTITTEQLTSGDAPDATIIIGERGGCFDIGTSGPTNYGDRSGSFANCDGGDYVDLAPGELNRNVHTSYVYETVYREFTQEDWRTFSRYDLTGSVRPIGFAHTAVQTGLIEAGERFARRLSSAPAGDGASGWAGVYDARSRTGGLNGDRRDRDGLEGGLSWGRPGLTFGVAIDGGETHSRGAGEAADIDLTQGGMWLTLERSGWFTRWAVGYGSGEIETERGDAGIGGVAGAAYDAEILTLAVSGGYRWRTGDWRIAPRVMVDRLDMKTDAFAETGGIGLMAPEHRFDRTRGSAGFEAGRTWRFGGVDIDLSAAIDAWSILDGEERRLPVAFAATPGQMLAITGAPQTDSGVDLQLAVEAGLSSGVGLRLFGHRREAGDDSGHEAGAALIFRW